MAKLELALLVGAESKDWLDRLEKAVAKLEGLTVKAPNKKEVKGANEDEFEDDKELTTQNDDELSFEEDGEDFEESPKKKQTKKTAKKETFDEDDLDDEKEESDDIEVSELKVSELKSNAKKSKAKKITIDDVNDACKARAADTSRQEVLGILRRKFKVSSVTELKPEQYGEVISAMEL